MQYSNLDDLVQFESFLQIRDDRFVQDMLHLIGNSWQGNDCISFCFDDKTWCGPHGMRDAERAFRNKGLSPLVLRRLTPIPRNDSHNLLPKVFSKFEFN